jgi:putative transposase
MELLTIRSMEELKRTYREWVEESLVRGGGGRESRWTESLAVGSKGFVERIKVELGSKAIGREVKGSDGSSELREREVSYKGNIAGENSDLWPENTYSWKTSL